MTKLFVLKEKHIDDFKYYFTGIVFEFLTIALILFVGYITNNFIYTIITLSAFVALRAVSNSESAFHFPDMKTCFIFTPLSIFGIVFIANMLSAYWIIVLAICIILIASKIKDIKVNNILFKIVLCAVILFDVVSFGIGLYQIGMLSILSTTIAVLTT
jgi:hypothetical protein